MRPTPDTVTSVRLVVASVTVVVGGGGGGGGDGDDGNHKIIGLFRLDVNEPRPRVKWNIVKSRRRRPV